MTNQHFTRAKAAYDSLDYLGKLIRNLSLILAVLAAVWSSALGPGIKNSVQDYVGTAELRDQVTFIETHMAPPKVANWESQSVRGECKPDSCFVTHFISRTDYGVGCGTPEARAELRVDGVVSNLPLPDFEEVRATSRGVSVTVPLGISRFVPAGVHQYRFINIYPTCSWAREPIPRYSPWFDVTVVH